MVGRTKAPTAAQRRRMDAVSKMRCIACDIAGQSQPNKTEVHHLVDKGNRRASGGHDATIPLCKWHHRGVFPGKVVAPVFMQDGSFGQVEITPEAGWGPSLALRKRAFVAAYGTERELLAKVDALLAEGL